MTEASWGTARSTLRCRSGDAADSPTQSAARQNRFEELRRQRTRTIELSQVLDLPGGALRGVSIPNLLAHGAWLYSDGGAAARAQPDAVFSLSRHVRRIDLFISHAWRSPRFAKCLALWSYLNTRAAIRAAVATNLALFWVALLLPNRVPSWATFNMVSLVDHTMHETIGLSALPIAFLVFALFMTSAHHLTRRHEYGFLDIACISQNDAALQARGISTLGAVLARSERMVLLIDQHYWKRLWCVFEVAAFCRHAAPSRLVFLPLHTTILELGFLLYFTIFTTAILLLGTTEFINSPLIFGGSLAVITQPIILVAVRGAVLSRKALADLHSFTVAESSCFSEFDRAAITAVISEWYTDHAAGECDPDRLAELGTHKFESFVRHSLAPSISRQQDASVARVCLLSFGVAFQGPALAVIASSSVSALHAALLVVVFTFISMVFVAVLIPAFVLLLSAIFELRDAIAARHGALTRHALTAGVYVLATVSTIWLPPAYFYARRLVATPNLLLSPHSTGWRVPDDGLDEESRRYVKYYLVLAWHLLGAAVYQSMGTSVDTSVGLHFES